MGNNAPVFKRVAQGDYAAPSSDPWTVTFSDGDTFAAGTTLQITVKGPGLEVVETPPGESPLSPVDYDFNSQDGSATRTSGTGAEMVVQQFNLFKAAYEDGTVKFIYGTTVIGDPEQGGSWGGSQGGGQGGGG